MQSREDNFFSILWVSRGYDKKIRQGETQNLLIFLGFVWIHFIIILTIIQGLNSLFNFINFLTIVSLLTQPIKKALLSTTILQLQIVEDVN